MGALYFDRIKKFFNDQKNCTDHSLCNYSSFGKRVKDRAPQVGTILTGTIALSRHFKSWVVFQIGVRLGEKSIDEIEQSEINTQIELMVEEKYSYFDHDLALDLVELYQKAYANILITDEQIESVLSNYEISEQDRKEIIQNFGYLE